MKRGTEYKRQQHHIGTAMPSSASEYDNVDDDQREK